MRSETITRTPKQNPLRVRASDPAEASRPALLALPRARDEFRPVERRGRRRPGLDATGSTSSRRPRSRGSGSRGGALGTVWRSSDPAQRDGLQLTSSPEGCGGRALRARPIGGPAPAAPPRRDVDRRRSGSAPGCDGGRSRAAGADPSSPAARPKPEAPLGRPSRWASAVAASPPGRAERGAPVPDLEPRPAAPVAEADGRRRAGKAGSARFIAEARRSSSDSARPRPLAVGPATRPCRPTCPRRLPAIAPSPRLRPRMPQSPARPPAGARPLPSRGRAPDLPARTLPAVRTFRQPLPRDVPGTDAPGIAAPSYNPHRVPRAAMRRACRPPRLGVRPAPRPSRIRRDPRIGHGAGRWRSAAHRRRVSAK